MPSNGAADSEGPGTTGMARGFTVATSGAESGTSVPDTRPGLPSGCHLVTAPSPHLQWLAVSNTAAELPTQCGPKWQGTSRSQTCPPTPPPGRSQTETLGRSLSTPLPAAGTPPTDKRTRHLRALPATGHLPKKPS